jgi:hypothetical protein
MVCRHLSAVDSATKLHTGRVQPARERTFAKGRSGSETCRLGAPVKQRSRALGSLPWMEAIPKIRYTLFLRSRCVFV